jgi:UDP-N-acetylmuramoyl-tripeptide--D-alanyl-D-alanine ligase
MPNENRIQKRFWNEAHAKLLHLKPTVVGITGSYGKTSVKHILGHILGASAPTLSTPGSVNTPMGISRIVREELGPHHRFFICEMGAYGPGSIARLCRLAPPDLAVITAIGPAHYERFKSLDAVARTKFELAEAAVKRGGRVILAEDTLQFPDAQSFYDRHKSRVVLVGSGAQCTYRLGEPIETAQGIEVTVTTADEAYHLRSHLYGRHQASNLALAFAAACELGFPPQDAISAIASTPQISHRLEVNRQGTGQVVIDDAYNSNPAGFASALEVLDVVRNGSGRRILVTPGMVELGTLHDEAHSKAGLKAAKHVDVLLAVLPGRIATFLKAFREANPQASVIECATFADARQWMQENLQATDVVLLENDLPDLYEKKLRL